MRRFSAIFVLMEQETRILVVDDEEALCEAIRFNLEEAGFTVDTALSAEEALSTDLTHYSLILLDIMMGEISGTRMAAILKANPLTEHIPIIFCTARDSEDDMIAGLELGSDDYITKPFSMRNVVARVKTVLRRSHHGSASEDLGVMTFGGLAVCASRKSCTVDGLEVKMPRKEFEILSLLISNRGRIFSREEILKRIWPDEVIVVNRVVDVNITRLRSKLGPYGKYILTRPGYGYCFAE